jgi:hypothetical protein
MAGFWERIVVAGAVFLGTVGVQNGAAHAEIRSAN